MPLLSHTCLLASAAELAPLLDQLAEKFAWTDKVRFQIELALEELIVNTLTHGRTDAEQMGLQAISIHMHFEQNADELHIALKDNAIAFDPTQFDAPDVTSSAEDRQVGGLGQFFAAKMMDSITYKRDGGMNHLQLYKRLR